MGSADIRFSKHAVERMGERDITFDEVFAIIERDDVVRHDRADPHVSTTRLGWIARATALPVHVVTVIDADGATLVVTVYLPDPDLWDSTFTRRVK